MMKISIFRFIFLLLGGSNVLCSASFALPRLSDPARLRYLYSTADDRVHLTWSGNKNRAQTKYKVTVYDGTDAQLKRAAVKSNFLTLKKSLFAETQRYSFTVQATATPTRSASRSKKKVFTFTLRVPTAEAYQTITVKNSSGRNGVYFLPKSYRLKSLPVMLLLHGSSINGDRAAKGFRKLAAAKNFIVIAPDSVNVAGWSYEVDDGPPTEDQTHIQDCINEVLSLPFLTIEPGKVLVAGVSAGGEVAGFLGSRNSFFTSFADLHGGINFPSLGSNNVPVWLSTGSADTLRPPAELKSYAARFPERGFTDVTYHEYPIGHDIPEAEKSGLIAWWLGR